MKIYSLIILAILLPRLNAQDIIFNNTVPKDEILTRLFEGKWLSNTNECSWKPNLSERLDFGESYDGRLYTSIDTIFEYKTSYGKQLLLFTSTKIKEDMNSYQSCHGCAPSISIIQLKYNNQSNDYTLDFFEKFIGKYGSYGEFTSEISLLQIGNDDYCIKIDGGYINQGISMGYTSLIMNGKEILYFVNSENNSGIEEYDLNQFSFTTSLFVDAVSKKIILIKKGTDKKYENNRSFIEKVNETIVYEFREGGLHRICDQ